MLVREGSRDKLDDADRALGPDASGADQAGRSATCAGRCSASTRRQVDELRGKIDHFFHLAAIYDMTAPTTSATRGSTSAARATRSTSPTRSTPGTSTTCPRSPSPASYKGIFTEDMFDEGQKLAHPLPPHEVRVREASCASSRRRRGASTARRSSSATRRPARWTRSTAPTTSSRRSRRSRHALPEWVPLVGLELGLDEHRARSTTSPPRSTTSPTSPELDGQAFHLIDPQAASASARCSTRSPAPPTRRSSRCAIDKRLTDTLPKGVARAAR